MSEAEYQKYICKTCGLIYDEAEGDPDSGLAPGTRFEDIPDDWYCPLCLVSKADFILLDENKAKTNTQAKPKRKIGGKDGIIVIGSGYAGWQAVESIKALNPEANVSLITGCDGTVYPKPAISMALSQGRTPEDLKEATAEQKALELGISLKTRTKVISINSKRKKLMTTGGSFEFDKLILAVGAQAIQPKIEGDAGQDVMTINDLTAYRKFRKALEGKQKVTLIGGGLIAVEMAEDLASQKIEVDLMVRSDHLMRQLLPNSISETLLTKLEEKGIRTHFNTEIVDMTKAEDGYHLMDQHGKHFATDMVIGAVGLKPSVDLAKKTGLDINRGICINAYCQTSHPDIYALGDCAEIDGVLQAYLEPIRRQAKTLAAHLLGQKAEPFQVLPPLVKTKTPSLSIMATPPLDNQTGEWVLQTDAGTDQETLYMSEEHVTGFALSGSKVTAANQLYQQYFA